MIEAASDRDLWREARTCAGSRKSHGVLQSQGSKVGQTSRSLNVRFNEHRSEINRKVPNTELSKHFIDNACDFDEDLVVHILQQNVTGSRIMREKCEDQWMRRLSTLTLNGLNTSTGEYSQTHDLLFK